MEGTARGPLLGFAGTIVLVLGVACAKPVPRPPVTVHWLAGHTAPAFDPGGAPDPLRRAIERALSYGLFERDSAGRVRPLAAEAASASPDARVWTVRLRPGLRFTDGTRATSADFRAALLAALGRKDHATAAWLLAPVEGMERVRAGQPLPPLGIEAPNPATLVFRLARPDSAFPEHLACAGLGAPWRIPGALAWRDAVGLGPYRVAFEQPGRMLTLVRADSTSARQATADTVELRFAPGAPRVRFLMRHGLADVVWPLPATLLAQALPAGYRSRDLAARPPRLLLLLFREDIPPTTKLPARQALAHAVNHEEILAALDGAVPPAPEWLEGAGAFDFPRLDAADVRDWLARGNLGASFHVVLAYDADGPGAEVARVLQGEWAQQGLYVELRPLRGTGAVTEPLAASAAQVQLLVAQAPLPGAAAQLAQLVMPLRGPAIGSFRTGWRTRDFDRWIAGPAGASPSAEAGLDAAAVQARLDGERLGLPLATLPWSWVEREGAPGAHVHPEFGLEFTAPRGETPAGGSGNAGSH